MSDLHLPAGSATDGSDPVLITPERAGWEHSGLRVIDLEPDVPRRLETGVFEMALIAHAGAFTVEVDDGSFDVAGRTDVWDRVSDWVYLPRGTDAVLSSASGATVALPMAIAKRERQLQPAYVPAEDVPVVVRGAGQATRTIVNFCHPDAFDADSLMAVEVYTPPGNWSSYPPHKHDGRPGSPETCTEAVLEEIYYFRISGADGFGFHRTYAADGAFDDTVTVRDGDVFLVPHGYHGPCVAPPGYPMYYLNVLAGPQAQRSMAFCTDPAHDWIWDAWEGAAQDPRCPVVGA